ncbi:MAG: transglutaminase domain-containing protein [Ignavibacteriota bacterium]
MNRRHFVKTGLALPAAARLFAQEANKGWRTFEVTTRVEVLKPVGATRVAVPGALTVSTPYQKTLSNTFQCETGQAQRVESKADGLAIVSAEFPEGATPALTVTSRVSTRDWSADLAAKAGSQKASAEELQHFLRATKFMPTDGIVKETATEITKGARTDLDKARAIYEWIVENAHRDPKVRGCGLGDVRFMLESKDLGGKCADLNALYVALARSAGLPARDVYGIRVAKSELGCKSLGAASATVTKAQHCRAEVYLHDSGWLPVDPADVRKVMLEEPPGNRPIDDDMVSKARARLFGSWEMNWMAYNFAHDVAMPGSSGRSLAFLMYPQAETAEGRVDCLDPDSFRYEITSREIAA